MTPGKTLGRFKEYLNRFPPSPELTKGFLAQYANKKPRTLYRYAQMIKVFMRWYGEPMDDFKVKVPKTLPPYTKDSEVERLFSAIENKKTHKGCITKIRRFLEDYKIKGYSFYCFTDYRSKFNSSYVRGLFSCYSRS